MSSPQANAVFKTELPARTKTAQKAVTSEASEIPGGMLIKRLKNNFQNLMK